MKQLTEEQQQRTAERRAASKETCKAIKAKIDAGYKVKKGEQGYPIFSRPVAVIQAERGKEVTADDKYFSTCYLFHIGQVEVIKEAI